MRRILLALIIPFTVWATLFPAPMMNPNTTRYRFIWRYFSDKNKIRGYTPVISNKDFAMNYPSPTAVLNIGLITSNPDVRSGPPVILGTSLEVVDIVLVRLHQRLDADEIAVWFQISPAEAHAALAYYYLHKDAIDALIQEREHVIIEMKERLRDRRPKPLRG